jgi:hypothetical protein
MAIHARYKLPVFWDDEFKRLDYVNEDFNDPESTEAWTKMRSAQPSWNDKFVKIYQEMGWKDIGTSYYRMTTGTVLPTHSDLYVRYIKLHNLKGQEHRIRRAIIFLEDWKAGHYSEIAGHGMVNWEAGTALEWEYALPHAAANIGIEPRYTLQITGWV